MDSIVITALDEQKYRMTIMRGTDGFYHLTFIPCSIYNNQIEDIKCDTAEEAFDRFEKNKRFYTGSGVPAM